MAHMVRKFHELLGCFWLALMVPVKDVYNISKFGAGMTLAHVQGCSQVSDQDCLPHLGIQECCPP